MSVEVNAVNHHNSRVMVQGIKIKDLSETDKKALIFQALNKEGFSQADVANIVNCDRSHINRIAKKEATGLLAPLATLAKKRVKDVLKGQAIGNTEKAKTSDVLNAASMVLDRADPKINRSEIKSLSAHIEITAEDRDRFMKLIAERNNAQLIGNQEGMTNLPVDNQPKSL